MPIKNYIKESLKYILRSPIVVRKYINEVDQLYNISPEELRKRNERRFLKIFRRLYNSSAYYAELCKVGGVFSANDIRHLEDIVKLPILTKEMIKAHGEELLTRRKRGLIKNHTSGTTGTPLTVYEDWPALWREQAYLYCYRKRCGYTYGEPLVSLRGSLPRKDISLKVHVSNTLYLSVYNINTDTAEQYDQLIIKHKPKAIEGYPSALYSLALVLKDKGLECHIPITFTSSETLFDYQHRLIEDIFHTQIFDHYGTTERTISLEEAFDHNGYFESPGYGIEEYHDGYILSTSLINEVFPLIRYRTDDRMVLKTGVTKSTEGFIPADGIQAIDGRAIAYIIGKDGTEYSDSGLTFLFKVINGVRFAQFVQTRKGETDLNIVPDNTFSDEDKRFLLHQLDEKIGLSNMDINIHLIKEEGLHKSKRGKLALVVNDIRN